LDDFTDSVKKRISDLGLEAMFSQRRHLSDGCGVECTSGGISLPLGDVGDYGNGMSKLVKLIHKPSSIKSRKEEEANRARRIADLFCKTTNMCENSGEREFEFAYAKFLLFKFFDFSTKLVIGTHEGEFKARIKIGGFLNVGFTAPRSSWFQGSRESEHAVDYEGDGYLFREQANIAQSIGKINCLLDFIETTRNFGEFSPTFDEEIYETMKQAWEIVDKRDSFRPDKNKFAWWLVEEKYLRDTTGKELYKMVDMLEKKKDYDSQIRAEYPSDHNFLDHAPEGSNSKCAEPIRKSIFESNNSVSLSKLMKDLPKGYGAPIRKKLHDFYASKLYEVFSEIEFHTTSYTNLFGAGMDVGIERESLLGNFEIDTTELSLTSVGPFWVNQGEWAIPFADMLADHAPWRVVEWATKFFSQTRFIDSRDSPTKEHLIDAMINAGKDNAGAEHLSFAQRIALKVEWSFLELTINIIGTRDDSLPYGTHCRGPVCIGTGFDPANFVTPGIENCVNKVDTSICDISIDCIELTERQCLQNNDNTPCTEKAFTDCPATCGLFERVKEDSDWTRCNVIDACEDTQSLLYFPDDDPSTPGIGFQCQQLDSGNCTLNASSGDGATNMLVWKWCPNHCGYEDESIREENDFSCTVRPPILPSDPPSVSPTLTPSEGPTSSTAPSLSPSSKPTGPPTARPSESPSTIPSGMPSKSPSSKPNPQQTTSPAPLFDCSTLKQAKACKDSPVCEVREGNCHPKKPSSLFTNE